MVARDQDMRHQTVTISLDGATHRFHFGINVSSRGQVAQSSQPHQLRSGIRHRGGDGVG